MAQVPPRGAGYAQEPGMGRAPLRGCGSHRAVVASAHPAGGAVGNAHCDHDAACLVRAGAGGRRRSSAGGSRRPNMTATSRVAIVMLTLNQRETTLRALRSLTPEDRRRFPVLLWDNGSTDGTVDAVAAEFPEVLTHRHPENLGVASGRNAGAALAVERLAPTHLLFLDNDLVLTPTFVDALLAPFSSDGRIGQTQAKLR